MSEQPQDAATKQKPIYKLVKIQPETHTYLENVLSIRNGERGKQNLTRGADEQLPRLHLEELANEVLLAGLKSLTEGQNSQ